MSNVKKEIKRSKSEIGQGTIEAILILVLLVGIGTLVKKELSDENIIGNLIQEQWKSVQSMIENGSWDKSKSEDEVHPQIFNLTREGDDL